MKKGPWLISVVGPTAIGKTGLAIALAEHFKTEVLSSDSRQFYREMAIGTAVPTVDELRKVPHHFIQHIGIGQAYSVGDFEREALALLQRLFKKHRVVVMAGGSGLYVKAVTQGLDDFPEVDPNIRKSLNSRLQSEGIASLQEELLLRDPEYYNKVDLQNPHRLVRALEISIGSGKPYSSFTSGSTPKRNFKTLTIGLKTSRHALYERINTRVDKMLEQGLLQEARGLYEHRQLNALQTVGYKELFEYMDGNCELADAVEEIKKNTRRFAKRQLTWFRKQEDIQWFDIGQSRQEIITYIENTIDGK